jgi:hypothetical protein
MPIDSSFRVDSSGVRSQKSGFFDCNNMEKSWWIACFFVVIRWLQMMGLWHCDWFVAHKNPTTGDRSPPDE